MGKNVKCYGMQIDSAEVLLNIPNGTMTKLLDCVKTLGVFQDPEGQLQILLFEDMSQRDSACNLAKDFGFSSAMPVANPIFAEEKYLVKPEAKTEQEQPEKMADIIEFKRKVKVKKNESSDSD